MRVVCSLNLLCRVYHLLYLGFIPWSFRKLWISRLLLGLFAKSICNSSSRPKTLTAAFTAYRSIKPVFDFRLQRLSSCLRWCSFLSWVPYFLLKFRFSPSWTSYCYQLWGIRASFCLPEAHKLCSSTFKLGFQDFPFATNLAKEGSPCELQLHSSPSWLLLLSKKRFSSWDGLSQIECSHCSFVLACFASIETWAECRTDLGLLYFSSK